MYLLLVYYYYPLLVFITYVYSFSDEDRLVIIITIFTIISKYLRTQTSPIIEKLQFLVRLKNSTKLNHDFIYEYGMSMIFE